MSFDSLTAARFDGYQANADELPCLPPAGMDSSHAENWVDGWHEAESDRAQFGGGYFPEGGQDMDLYDFDSWD